MSESQHSCLFSDLIQSDLFTFKIGEEQKLFVVHSSAIATTSAPFRALVNGGLGESESRCAELKNVDPEDFIRFLEYAYRRDYTVPSWVLDESVQTTSDADPRDDPPPVDESNPLAVPDAEADADATLVLEEDAATAVLGDASPAVTPKPVKKKSKKMRDMAALRSTFYKRKYIAAGALKADLNQNFQPKANSAADQDFTTVFLAHARLYTFADMRLIYPLKNLALHKLHKTLMDFQLYNKRVGDVVELARYAYDNGPDRSKVGVMNDLRQLVVEYMACEVDTIGKHKVFKTFLEEGGEFVTDFWGIVSKYLLKA